MKAKLENLCHYSFQLRRSKFWWQRHARTLLQVSVPKNSQYSRHSKLSLLMELDPFHPFIYPLLLYDQGVNMHILWQSPSSTLFLHTQSLRQFTLQLCFFILQYCNFSLLYNLLILIKHFNTLNNTFHSRTNIPKSCHP